MNRMAKIQKAEDDEKRLVLAAVYVPDKLDSQGDYMTAEEIEKAAYRFAERGNFHNVDLGHNNKRTGAYIVETFIAREGDPDFQVPGTWAVMIHVPDDDLWAAIKRGDINGFSMEAAVRTGPGEVDVPGVPFALKGETEVAAAEGEEPHSHEFEAFFDENGELTGGRTSVHKGKDGKEHFHVIRKPVVTEKTGKHAHRFVEIKEMELAETIELGDAVDA